MENKGKLILGGGGLRNVTTCDMDGGGVNKSWNSCDVIYAWPLMEKWKPSNVCMVIYLIVIPISDFQYDFQKYWLCSRLQVSKPIETSIV